MLAIIRESDWEEVLSITNHVRITYVQTEIKGSRYYVITSGPLALLIRLRYEYWPAELGDANYEE